jgi:hypothetical protein
MSTTRTATQLLPPDTTIQEELATWDDEAVFEMTNLPTARTGIAGVLWLSTVMAAHGPRVKYFVKTEKGQPSFSVSVSNQPRVLANSLPARVLGQMAPSVIEWVKLNRAELLRFWNEGEGRTIDELNEFVAGLRKLPSR